MKEYVVDVKAFGHVTTTKVVAENAAAAVRLVKERYGIEVKVRSDG